MLVVLVLVSVAVVELVIVPFCCLFTCPLTLSMPPFVCFSFYFCGNSLFFLAFDFLGFQIPQEVSCKDPLGMQSKLIPDSAITASSTLAPATLLYAPGNARLHYTGEAGHYGGWIPAVSDHRQWLQINFGRDTQVTGIATQGFYHGLYYVKSYTLQYTDNRGFLQQYQPVTHTKVNILDNDV